MSKQRVGFLWLSFFSSSLAALPAQQQLTQQFTVVDDRTGIAWDVAIPGSTPPIPGTDFGNFVNGEPWVRASTVQVFRVHGTPGKLVDGSVSISPTHTGADYRNGMMLDPQGGGTWIFPSGQATAELDRRKVAYDDRCAYGLFSYFDPALWLTFPVTMTPGRVLVSTVSNTPGQSCSSCGNGGSSRQWVCYDDTLHLQLCPNYQLGCAGSPIRYAAILSCVGANLPPPPQGAFRKPYSMPSPTSRETLPYVLAGGLNWAFLPRVAPLAQRSITASQIEPLFSKVWLEHYAGEFAEDVICPSEHSPGYGGVARKIISSAALVACTNPDPTSPGPRPTVPADPDFVRLIQDMVQIGIDTWGLTLDPTHFFPGGGGKGGGRKFMLLFASGMLGSNSYPGMDGGPSHDWRFQVPLPAGGFTMEPRFKEDRQHYAAAITTNQAGWDWEGSPWKWRSEFGLAGTETPLPTPQLVEYHLALGVGPSVGQALALRMLHMEAPWNNTAFFGNADRYMIPSHARTLQDYTSIGSALGNRDPACYDPSNPYGQLPSYVSLLWDAYRWQNNQGHDPIANTDIVAMQSSALSSANVGFADVIDTSGGCPPARTPVLTMQQVPRLSLVQAVLLETQVDQVITDLFSDATTSTPWVSFLFRSSPGIGQRLSLQLLPLGLIAANDAMSSIDLTTLATSPPMVTSIRGYASTQLPITAAMVGASFVAQALFVKPVPTSNGSFCVALSNALRITVQP